MHNSTETENLLARRLPLLFLAARLILLISLPLEGLRGYGDFVHFYRLAWMGWPFLDYWVEFPPVFPFLSTLLYRAAGGQQHVYDYLWVILLTLAQAASLAIFVRISRRLHTPESTLRRSLWLFALLLALPYGWWYFDPLAALMSLLSVDWLLTGKDTRAGIAMAAGGLIKLFPLLGLALAWRTRPPRRALWISTLALGITFIAYSALAIASPELTSASLRSQAMKGSWETPWALLDGNLNTGNFGPESERLSPAAAGIPTGRPARISPWLALLPFAILGGWFFWRARIISPSGNVAFLGLAWVVFFLWSPGWSPQWVLYLLPFILLALPEREGSLLAFLMVLVNLLEWPVLLSRGLFWGLWLTIPLRSLLFLVMGFEFWKRIGIQPAVPHLSYPEKG